MGKLSSRTKARLGQVMFTKDEFQKDLISEEVQKMVQEKIKATVPVQEKPVETETKKFEKLDDMIPEKKKQSIIH